MSLQLILLTYNRLADAHNHTQAANEAQEFIKQPIR
jgi:hypothetical protein